MKSNKPQDIYWQPSSQNDASDCIIFKFSTTCSWPFSPIEMWNSHSFKVYRKFCYALVPQFGNWVLTKQAYFWSLSIIGSAYIYSIFTTHERNLFWESLKCRHCLTWSILLGGRTNMTNSNVKNLPGQLSSHILLLFVRWECWVPTELPNIWLFIYVNGCKNGSSCSMYIL